MSTGSNHEDSDDNWDGLFNQYITWRLPQIEDSDRDFEVIVVRCERVYVRYWEVGIGIPWRPRPHMDHRPSACDIL